MAAPTPSPSEFLTFYRTVVVRSTLRRSLLQSRQPTLRPVQAFNASTSHSHRQFSIFSAARKDLSTDSSVKTDQYTGEKGSKHATQKEAEGDHHDVQSSAIKEAKHAKDTGTGGNATEASDSAGGAAKAKKEFPEAPDMIGMQDERGGRGG